MLGTMVLVDTSVFVAHFRGKKDKTFQDLLLNDQILLSPFVRLELLQGVRKVELKALTRILGGLQELPFTEVAIREAEGLLVKAKGRGLSLGIVDLMLAAQSNLARCPIYSLDSVFDALAKWRLVAVL